MYRIKFTTYHTSMIILSDLSNMGLHAFDDLFSFLYIQNASGSF